MNWIAVAVGAGAGAFAVLASVGLLKLLGQSPNGKGASALYVILFLGGSAIGREYVVPRIEAYRAESAMLELPLYRTLKEHEPQAYQKIMAVFKEGITQKLPKAELMGSGRAVIAEVAARRVQHAADESLVKFAEHLTTVVMALHAKGGTACFSYLNPQFGPPVDFRPLIGDELAMRDLQVSSDLIQSAAGKTRAPLSEAEVSDDLQAVVSQLLTTYTPADLQALGAPQDPNIDKRKVCEVTSAVFSQASSLPAPNGARLIRYLIQKEK
jgi:hypothetical protein